MSVRITDKSDEVLDALAEAIQRGLEKCGLASDIYARVE